MTIFDVLEFAGAVWYAYGVYGYVRCVFYFQSI